MGTHVLKLNKGLIFAQKRANINVSWSAAPKWLLCQKSVISAKESIKTNST